MDPETPPPEKEEGNGSQAVTQQASGFGGFWYELKRRKVMRVGITYGVVAWLLIQVSATVFPQFGIPDWAAPLVTLLLVIGFPDLTSENWAIENEILAG